MALDHAVLEQEPVFEALIVPHRSLSPNGVRWLLGGIAGLTTLIALRFWLLGAWPVMGFSVIEIGIAVGLVSLNVRRARSSERVLLNTDTVRVVRTDPSGLTRESTLSAAWLNVVLEENPASVSKLLLSTRNQREEIGAALGEAEKLDLARALRAALHKLRHPEFNNPQL
jgi:uncharacterized membrane protein